MGFFKYLAAVAGIGGTSAVRNESPPAATPTDQAHGELLHLARTTCKWAREYRNGRELSDVELALSLFAFFRWLAMADLLRSSSTPEFEMHMQAANVSARAAALDVIRLLDERGVALAAVRRAHPGFKPKEEYRWGMSKAEHSEWNESVARGVVLGARALAYSFAHSVGYIPKLSEPAFGQAVKNQPGSRVRLAVHLAMAEALGTAAAAELM